MEKLINPGVGLHQNKVGEYLKKMVVSELSTTEQDLGADEFVFFKYVKNEFQNGTRFDSMYSHRW